MNNTKYVIGLAGLVVGFLVSFFWVSSYNRNNAPAAQTTVSGMPGGMPAANSSGGQQAMMGQVQQIIEKAKNNPKDFQAQVDAAKAFNDIKRVPETVEYLKRAYESDPQEFVRRSQSDLQDALPFIAMYYEQQKDYGESDKWIRHALDAAPSDAEQRTEFASTYIKRQPPQPDKAIQELQTVLKANPKDAHALGHLIEAYAVKKDAAGAEDALNRMREVEPGNKRLPALQSMVADLKAGKPVTLPKE
ncbi:MAG TPA: tetratricopeptide repeat protein [Blastocatellia bacterium]|nr:tetratricopeptide repeat protein [Blastocatellia bacterium]